MKAIPKVDDGDVIKGERAADGSLQVQVLLQLPTGRVGVPLPHVVHHSTTGFDCGYGGSGPADLALSILQLVLPEDGQEPVKTYHGSCSQTAWALHQPFKWAVTSRLPQDQPWTILVGEVREFVRACREGEINTGPLVPPGARLFDGLAVGQRFRRLLQAAMVPGQHRQLVADPVYEYEKLAPAQDGTNALIYFAALAGRANRHPNGTHLQATDWVMPVGELVDDAPDGGAL